ncbi:hypothetical protein [Chryseobacterium culicis]|uniref:hypothetical protein n=1 Tax=Chryseobacterium culicis TaxID=680127 RepID=UPI0018745FE3|nr:hypothetical protein [Chryseobacterium culicis]MBE4948329.1 hypothetical protein [Chryseobacterium culicis]
MFLFLAVATKIVIDDLFSRPLPTLQGIQIDPMMHSPQTLNSDAESDKDVNG